MNNIIAIDNIDIDTVPSTTQSRNGGGGGSSGSTSDYLLSLSHCQVTVDDGDGGGDGHLLSLPVTVSPSSFQFTFHHHDKEKTNIDSSSWSNDDFVGEEVGGQHRIGEISATFDHSLAVEYYLESVRVDNQEKKEEEEEEEDAVCSTQQSSQHEHGRSYNSTNVNDSPHHDHATIQRREQVASIMHELEEESRFIKKTLTVLGFLGVIFVIALVWVLRKISRTKRYHRRRRAVIINTDALRRYDVPREVGAANDGGEKKEGGSIIQFQSRDEVIPEVSPLHPSSGLNIVGLNSGNAVEKSNVDDDIANKSGGAGDHETLHLVTPFTPTLEQDPSAQARKRSPRHWYEDFLSPPTQVKHASQQSSSISNGNGNDQFSLAKKEDVIARSLFSPLKSNAKNDNFDEANDNDAIADKDVYEDEGLTTHKKNKTTSYLPKHLNFGTPMTRSAFSPRPSSVSVLELSNNILSSTSFDESLGGFSLKSEDATLEAAQTESPAMEPSFGQDISFIAMRVSRIEPRAMEPSFGQDISSIVASQTRDEAHAEDVSHHIDSAQVGPTPKVQAEPQAVEPSFGKDFYSVVASDTRDKAHGSLDVNIEDSSPLDRMVCSEKLVSEYSKGDQVLASNSEESSASLDGLVSDRVTKSDLICPKYMDQALKSEALDGESTDESFILDEHDDTSSSESSHVTTATDSFAEDLAANVPPAPEEDYVSMIPGVGNIETDIQKDLSEVSSLSTATADDDNLATNPQLTMGTVQIHDATVPLSTAFADENGMPPELSSKIADPDDESVSSAQSQLAAGTSADETDDGSVVNTNTSAEVSQGAEEESVSSSQSHLAADTSVDNTVDGSSRDDDLEESDSAALEEKSVASVESSSSGRINSPPKILTTPSSFRFAEELVERATGTKKTPSPAASVSEFSTILARRSFEADTGKVVNSKQSKPVVGNFATSLAEKASELGHSSDSSDDDSDLPSKQRLTPSTALFGSPASQRTGTSESSESQFLSDYWV